MNITCLIILIKLIPFYTHNDVLSLKGEDIKALGIITAEAYKCRLWEYRWNRVSPILFFINNKLIEII